jgi:protein-S-isoprenylcysteine O-methyltransferase Ste14
MNDLPAVITATTICAYWLGVGVMIVRVKRHSRDTPILSPKLPLERFMGLVFIPVVALWMVLPWLARNGSSPLLALSPSAADVPAYVACRWLAAIVAVLCFVATVRCWARMGRDWRMAVAVGEKTNLITDGPFSRIRHPIYAFQILLMICTVVVVPTLPMVVVAVTHFTLMNVKARNEERYLLQTQPEDYSRYVQRTGRFFPRLS